MAELIRGNSRAARARAGGPERAGARTPIRVAAWVTSAAVLAGTLTACGSGGGNVTILNTEKVERAIEQSILSKRGLRAHVSCPSGVHQRKGLVFTCVADLAHGRTSFIVTEVDDRGNVTYVGR